MSTFPLTPTSLLRDVFLLSFCSDFGASEGLDLLSIALSPSQKRYLPLANHYINSESIYRLLLALSFYRLSLSRGTTLISNRMTETLNQILALSTQIETGLDEVSDTLSIAEAFLSASGKRVFRLYPEASKASDRTLPPHAMDVTPIAVSGIKTVKGAAQDLKQALNSLSHQVATLTPEESQSELELSLSAGSLLNGIELTLGGSSGKNARVDRIQARNSNGEWNDILLEDVDDSKLLTSFTSSIRPTISDTIRISLTHNEPVYLQNIALKKIRYLSEGVLQERRIFVGTPILGIAISEESVLWMDTRLRKLMEIVHEVSIDGATWHRIRARADSENTDLPELLLINSPVALSGAKLITSTTPVEEFYYRATFRKIAEIPPYLLNELATNLKATKRVVDVFTGISGNSQYSLSSFPANEDISVAKLGMGRASYKAVDGVLIGQHKLNQTLSLPAFFNDGTPNLDSLQVQVGGVTCSFTTGTPSESQYTLADRNHILLSTSLPTDVDVVISYTAPRLSFYKTGEGKYRADLPFPADGSIDNASLDRFDPPKRSEFVLSKFNEVGKNVYRATIPANTLTIQSVQDYWITNGSAVPSESSYVTDQKTYISGMENTALGYWSCDTDNGYLYFYSTQNPPKDRSIKVIADYELKNQVSSGWEFSIDGKGILISSLESTHISTVCATGKRITTLNGPSFQNGGFSTRFTPVQGLIKVKDAIEVPADTFQSIYVKDLPIRDFTSLGGGYYKLKLNYIPVDASVPFTPSGTCFVAQKTATALCVGVGDWALIDNTGLFIKASGVTPSGSASYNYMFGYGWSATQYYCEGSNVYFDRVLSNAIPLHYDMAAYQIEYNFAQPVESKDIEIDHKQGLVQLKRNYQLDLLSGLPQANASIPSGFAVTYDALLDQSLLEVDANTITLIPKHIDVEVLTR